MSQNRVTVTVKLNEEEHSRLTEELEYGDSKAGWIREAIRQRIDEEDEN